MNSSVESSSIGPPRLQAPAPSASGHNQNRRSSERRRMVAPPGPRDGALWYGEQDQMRRIQPDQRLWLRLVVGGLAIALVVERLATLAALPPTDFDDAYMFIRYADNL